MSLDGYKKGKTRRQRAKLRLHRGIDGRIKTMAPDDGKDIGDVWAQQERIRLAEAIAEDKKHKDRKDLKRQSGLVGVAKKEAQGVTDKIILELFGEQGLYDRSKNNRLNNSVSRRLSTLILRLVKSKSAKVLYTTVGVLVVLLLANAVYLHHRNSHHEEYGTKFTNADDLKVGQQSVSPSPAAPIQNHSAIKLLPSGRTIDYFGGWFLSRIPKIGDVYNYKNQIGGVTVVVGQQTLTGKDSTAPDLVAQEVAHYLNANRTLSADANTTIYIGTTQQNTQTIVLVKDGVLVLMAAGGNLPDTTWIAYVDSLQPST
jgi:hypothetical protein